MQTVNVQIDISTPTGRKLMNEIQKHTKVAKIQAEMPQSISQGNTYYIDEVFDICIDILSEHYNVDGHKIWRNIK